VGLLSDADSVPSAGGGDNVTSFMDFEECSLVGTDDTSR